MIGDPLSLLLLPALTKSSGELLSGEPNRGRPVFAASFIRERRIVLDLELVRHKPTFRLIFVHELFHFVWVRLGNKVRKDFGSLLSAELCRKARGELGESSCVQKTLLQTGDARNHHRRWREYVCESFCDTAAWMYSGAAQHRWFTLAERWQNRRAMWFDAVFSARARY